MTNPENVRPKNFTLEHVVYDDGDFSVAVGIWTDDDTRRVAMRWNGPGPGYPKLFQHPVWFQLPASIGPSILAALREHEGARLSELEEAMISLGDPRSAGR